MQYLTDQESCGGHAKEVSPEGINADIGDTPKTPLLETDDPEANKDKMKTGLKKRFNVIFSKKEKVKCSCRNLCI